MLQTKTHTCPAKGETVVLMRQILCGISGIGDADAGVQADHDCSRAADCQHRTQTACIVYQLNGAGEK